MRTSVAITAIDRIPGPKERRVYCKLCGADFPRWQRKVNADDPPQTGVKLLLAHQLQVHGDEE